MIPLEYANLCNPKAKSILLDERVSAHFIDAKHSQMLSTFFDYCGMCRLFLDLAKAVFVPDMSMHEDTGYASCERTADLSSYKSSPKGLSLSNKDVKCPVSLIWVRLLVAKCLYLCLVK